MTRDCLLCSQNAQCHLEVREKVWTIDMQGKGSGMHMPQRRGALLPWECVILSSGMSSRK